MTFFNVMKKSGMMNKPGLLAEGEGAFFLGFWKRHTEISDVPYSYASDYGGMY